MNNPPKPSNIRFRSISHLSLEEATAILTEMEPQPQPQPNHNTLPMPVHNSNLPPPFIHTQPIIQPQQPITLTTYVRAPENIHTRRISEMNRRSQTHQHQQGSRINQFLKPIDLAILREEFTTLWYQKLALESSAERLLQQGRKKDDLIAQLTLELQQTRSRRII